MALVFNACDHAVPQYLRKITGYSGPFPLVPVYTKHRKKLCAVQTGWRSQDTAPQSQEIGMRYEQTFLWIKRSSRVQFNGQTGIFMKMSTSI